MVATRDAAPSPATRDGRLDRRSSVPGWRRLAGDLALLGWRVLGRPLPVSAAPRPPSSDRPSPGDRRLRALVVVPMPIEPPIHGGAVRITNLVRRLAHDHDVTLLLLLEATDAPDHRRALVPPCREVLVHPLGDDAGRDRWGLWPALARPFASPALADRIRALVHGRGFDLVQLEFTQLGGLVDAAQPAAGVLVEHDLSFRSHQRQRATGVGRFGGGQVLGRGRLESARLRRFELQACAAADQVHVMSDVDRSALAAELGGAQHLLSVPNGVDTRAFVPPADSAQRAGVLLLGSFPHLPNLDAFDWTVREIWPLIRSHRPDATLTVAGARPPAEVLAWDGRDGIQVAGEVADVRPLLQSHRTLLVPLRSGSGTRLKILEAMACGLPVVSTAIGAEGLPCRDGAELLLADEPQQLAAAVERLLAEDDLAQRLAVAGRTLVETSFDWQAISRTADTGWRQIAAPRAVAPTGPPAAEPAADVAVVIPVLDDVPRLAETLAAVRRQIGVGRVDGVLVDARHPSRAPLEHPGWRIVQSPRPDALGPALDRGLQATSAELVVLLGADCVPADEHWMARLTTPLRAAEPPAAVQGAVWEQAGPDGVRVDTAATAETRRWITRFGLRFDASCAAIRRDAWRQAPFGPWPRLPELHWQRIAAECRWLILPCWDAAAVRAHHREARWWWSELRREAREWRGLGIPYRLPDAVADLAWPRLAPHRHGWLPLLRRPLRRQPVARVAWLRPLAQLFGRAG